MHAQPWVCMPAPLPMIWCPLAWGSCCYMEVSYLADILWSEFPVLSHHGLSGALNQRQPLSHKHFWLIRLCLSGSLLCMWPLTFQVVFLVPFHGGSGMRGGGIPIPLGWEKNTALVEEVGWGRGLFPFQAAQRLSSAVPLLLQSMGMQVFLCTPSTPMRL